MFDIQISQDIINLKIKIHTGLALRIKLIFQRSSLIFKPFVMSRRLMRFPGIGMPSHNSYYNVQNYLLPNRERCGN